MDNISSEELIKEYYKFYDNRKLFEQKIDLNSYFMTFSEWLTYYINDDIYGVDLKECLSNSNNRVYKTNMTIDTCKEIAHDFYYDLGKKMGESFDAIINNTENNIVNIDKNIFGEKIENTCFSSISDNLVDSHLYGIMEIKNYDTIETLYGIVHECMHAITTVNNKYTESTFAVREVPAYFVESLLCDYLLENYEKYNLNKENIFHDVNLWKLRRYVDYFDIENNSYNSEYFLGLLLNAKFEQLSNAQKKQQLKLLVDYLNNDRLDIALKSIDFRLNEGEKKETSPYLKALSNNFMNIVKNMKQDEYFTVDRVFK